ncbi:hypothetical protein ACFFNY_24855 [Paenibacillus hodogayensis]|uniref:Uncharacterized protein n=1 Tax=Paenibacillus hodogayensis TaxID=279208 RepID=A0ABV5W2L8_9BACL
MPHISQVRTRVKYYAYWNRKTRFAKETDRYGKWCAFAVEDEEIAYRICSSEGTAKNGDLLFCP